MCSSPICSEEHLVFYHIFFQIFYKYFLIFKFENEKWRKIPKFLFPVTSENEKNTEFRRNSTEKFNPDIFALEAQCNTSHSLYPILQSRYLLVQNNPCQSNICHGNLGSHPCGYLSFFEHY